SAHAAAPSTIGLLRRPGRARSRHRDTAGAGGAGAGGAGRQLRRCPNAGARGRGALGSAGAQVAPLGASVRLDKANSTTSTPGTCDQLEEIFRATARAHRAADCRASTGRGGDTT